MMIKVTHVFKLKQTQACVKKKKKQTLGSFGCASVDQTSPHCDLEKLICLLQTGRHKNSNS